MQGLAGGRWRSTANLQSPNRHVKRIRDGVHQRKGEARLARSARRTSRLHAAGTPCFSVCTSCGVHTEGYSRGGRRTLPFCLHDFWERSTHWAGRSARTHRNWKPRGQSRFTESTLFQGRSVRCSFFCRPFLGLYGALMMPFPTQSRPFQP